MDEIRAVFSAYVPLHRRSGGRPGFTLIEVLVVVAVIALLIGLAVPTIANSLDAAATVASRAKLSQFAVSNAAFEMDHDEPALWPEMFDGSTGELVRRFDRPAEVSTIGTVFNLRGFGAAGTTMHPIYKPQIMHEWDRLLNPYLVEQLGKVEDGDSAGAIDNDPDARADRTFFAKPGSPIDVEFSFEGLTNPDGVRIPSPSTLYAAAGTSYLTNTLWLDARIDGYYARAERVPGPSTEVEPRVLLAEYTLQRIRSWRQDATVFMAEGSMILTAHQGRDPAVETGVNERREHEVLFLDGHIDTIVMSDADVNETRNTSASRRQGKVSIAGAPCNDDSGQWQLFPEYRDECDGTPTYVSE
ncbi:MAG: prepilin-type N-terminal cleavage/methylation domain-containing protein [Planctomycetota bacterium]